MAKWGSMFWAMWEALQLANELAKAKTCPRSDSQVPLFRAVRPDELAQILATGSFINPYGFESKYFSTTPEGAFKEGKMLNGTYKDGPYTVVGTSIPSRDVTPDMTGGDVDGGVPTIVVPTNKLPRLSPPEVIGTAE